MPCGFPLGGKRGLDGLEPPRRLGLVRVSRRTHHRMHPLLVHDILFFAAPANAHGLPDHRRQRASDIDSGGELVGTVRVSWLRIVYDEAVTAGPEAFHGDRLSIE